MGNSSGDRVYKVTFPSFGLIFHWPSVTTPSGRSLWKISVPTWMQITHWQDKRDGFPEWGKMSWFYTISEQACLSYFQYVKYHKLSRTALVNKKKSLSTDKGLYSLHNRLFNIYLIMIFTLLLGMGNHFQYYYLFALLLTGLGVI